MDSLRSKRLVCVALAAAGITTCAVSRAVPAWATHQHGPEVHADSLAGDSGDSLLSYEALERWVVAANPELEAARQALAAARARRSVQGGVANPELEVVVGPGSIGDPELSTAYRVTVTQPLAWSKLGPRATVARYEAEAAAGELESTHNNLLRETREAYVDYVRSHASIRLYGELQSLVDELRRSALARYSSGLAGQSDPLQAEVELAHLDHERVVAERDFGIARARLNALLHRSWNATLPAPPAALEAPSHTAPLDSLVMRALAGRPELATAEARARASEARVRLARRERLPDVSLMAGYDAFWQEEPLRPMVGVRLDLPIWFGRLGASEREARAGAAAERARVAAARDRVALEVQQAYLAVHETAHEAELIRQSELPANRRALEAARAGYESGRNDFSALLGAERELLRVRLDEVRVLAEHQMARAELRRAVGGAGPGEIEMSPAMEERR